VIGWAASPPTSVVLLASGGGRHHDRPARWSWQGGGCRWRRGRPASRYWREGAGSAPPRRLAVVGEWGEHGGGRRRPEAPRPGSAVLLAWPGGWCGGRPARRYWQEGRWWLPARAPWRPVRHGTSGVFQTKSQACPRPRQPRPPATGATHRCLCAESSVPHDVSASLTERRVASELVSTNPGSDCVSPHPSEKVLRRPLAPLRSGEAPDSRIGGLLSSCIGTMARIERSMRIGHCIEIGLRCGRCAST